MSLKKQIIEDMKTAMKEKNVAVRDTLRVLKGEIERAENTKEGGKIELSDKDIINIVKKSIHDVKITTSDPEEIAALESYVPEQLTKEEMQRYVEKFAKTHGITEMSGMGKVMNHFKDNFNGLYDGKTLSVIVKNYLNS